VESGGFWEGKTRTALQALLHAAALDQRTQRDLFGWTLAPSFAADTVAILASHPHAAAGWGVSLALSSLADPRVLDTVTPEPGEQFDPAEFLTSNGTGYLLATGARLDPPLFTALDEIGNLASLPSLPMLMAEGGGTGITTMPILQSVSQARDRWGDHAAGAIGDASIVKSSSEEPPPPGTFKTFPHSSPNATSALTASPSANTAPAHCDAPPGGCRSCRMRQSGHSRSERGWCSYATRHRW
jgi:hypothetical protein